MSFCDMPPAFFRETFQRARKNHKCCECHKLILKGENYWRSTGKWDDISSYPQHTWCRAACTHLSKLDSDGCIPFTMMWDAWTDQEHPKTNPKYAKLRGYMAKVKKEMRNPVRKP